MEVTLLMMKHKWL